MRDMDWNRIDIYKPGPRRPDPPAPVFVRNLWTLTKPPNRTITADICEHAVGRELRMYQQGNPDNIWRTLLSRTGDGPLEAHAEEARTVLVAVGWEQARRV